MRKDPILALSTNDLTAIERAQASIKEARKLKSARAISSPAPRGALGAAT